MPSVDFARYRPFCLRAGSRSLWFLPPERLAPWQAIDQLAVDAQGEKALRAHFAGLLGTGRGCDADDEAIHAFLVELRLMSS